MACRKIYHGRGLKTMVFPRRVGSTYRRIGATGSQDLSATDRPLKVLLMGDDTTRFPPPTFFQNQQSSLLRSEACRNLRSIVGWLASCGPYGRSDPGLLGELPMLSSSAAISGGHQTQKTWFVRRILAAKAPRPSKATNWAIQNSRRIQEPRLAHHEIWKPLSR